MDVRFMKRSSNQQHQQKSIDQSQYKNKLVFGVPLKVNFQRHGQPLPQAIIQIMKYLRKHSTTTVGIFRKSGSRSRMSLMREHIERTNTFDFDDIERLFSWVGGGGGVEGLQSQSHHHHHHHQTITTIAQSSNTTNNNSPTTTAAAAVGTTTTPVTNDLNSIGSGFSSQSTSKSDLVDELTTTSASTSSTTAATAAAAVVVVSSMVADAAKQIVNSELIAIDLADILKQYFRELPECLFTNKISQMLIDIFTCKY